MVKTFKGESKLSVKPRAITYFSSFCEAEKFFEEKGGKFYDFSDTIVTIDGERAMAAVEHEVAI